MSSPKDGKRGKKIKKNQSNNAFALPCFLYPRFDLCKHPPMHNGEQTGASLLACKAGKALVSLGI